MESVLDHVTVENNSSVAITVQGANVLVRNSTVAGNGLGLSADFAYSTIYVTRSAIKGNSSGWMIQNGGSVLSYGDNTIDDNTTNSSAPPLVCGTSPCTAYK